MANDGGMAELGAGSRREGDRAGVPPSRKATARRGGKTGNRPHPTVRDYGVPTRSDAEAISRSGEDLENELGDFRGQNVFRGATRQEEEKAQASLTLSGSPTFAPRVSADLRTRTCALYGAMNKKSSNSSSFAMPCLSGV